MKFAQFLNSKGVTVQSVHSSKLNGFFRGLKKAAFFRTDKGVVEVIFFPEPAGAEGVRATERRRGGGISTPLRGSLIRIRLAIRLMLVGKCISLCTGTGSLCSAAKNSMMRCDVL